MPNEIRARELLVEWANAQPHWVRGIVREILATHQPMSPTELDGAYAEALSNYGLSGDSTTEVPKLFAGTDSADLGDKLVLRALREVESVNRLAPSQSIVFNGRMTVIFGENATGKSGYVRVLKRLAAVRSVEEILPDIHGPSPADQPHATIEYTLGAEDDSEKWNGESGLRPFTRMSIFDSRAVSMHLEGDLTYVYTPRDLALFKHTHAALQGVRERLEKARDEKKPTSNPFLGHFDRDSSIYTRIETLAPSTDFTELEQLAAVSDDEAATVETLRATVEALRSTTIASRLELARSDRDLLSEAGDAATTIVEFDWQNYADAVRAQSRAEEKLTNATNTAFAGLDVPGMSSTTWREFVQSGDAYWKEFVRESYPHEGDKCIYCRQELSDVAVALIQKYYEYCNNTYRRERDEAKVRCETLSAPIGALKPERLREAAAKKIAALGGQAVPAVFEAILKFADALAGFLPKLKGEPMAGTAALLPHARELQPVARAELENLEELIKTLTKQGEERSRALEQEATKLRELQARMTLKELLPQIRTHVQDAKWADRVEVILRNKMVLASLTAASKTASEDLLNRDFERHFSAKCADLRAPTVKLEFSGQRGEAARRKSLVASHKLSDILSEGEQRVIALADFLAEASIRTNSAPLIFDDPVNSLDHRRLEYIADCLYQLSQEHQVIVFTHSILLAMALLTRFEKTPADWAYYDISLNADGIPGIVTGGKHPRYDTPKILKGEINVLIQTAKKATGETLAALIERGYSRFRSWCEAVVEEDVLAGVTRRYQPNIMITALPKIHADRLEALRATILPLFEKACRITEAHSQPLETLGTRPTVTDFENDWKAAQEALRVYKG